MVAVSDLARFNLRSFSKIVDVAAIHQVIADADLVPETGDLLRSAGIEVTVP